MDNLEDFFTIDGITNELSASEAIVMVLVAFGLGSVIALLYRATHSGVNYRQSTAQTIVLLTMLVAVIMAVVGSNIASAFTLVGAMSIIRFRNAVRQTRDVGFIFFAMAIGMATGTRFYALALIAAAAVGVAIVAMSRFGLFQPTQASQTIVVRVPASDASNTQFSAAFERHDVDATLHGVATKDEGATHELSYLVTMPAGTSLAALTQALVGAGGSRIEIARTTDRMSP